jgi:hypothetical protein
MIDESCHLIPSPDGIKPERCSCQNDLFRQEIATRIRQVALKPLKL